MILFWLYFSATSADPWWQQRSIHFPHLAHEQALQQAGLSCLACHPFQAIDETDPQKVQRLSRIANEPLKAICHRCHIQDGSAPSDCDLCHQDMDSIRPQDHGTDYIRLHGQIAKADEQACATCHLDLQDCMDCHFQRQNRQQHRLGYRYSHGLEARLRPAQCGHCHQPHYCIHCHRQP